MAIAVDLALQGGGAHGAYGWGVVDALLEDGRFAVAAVSGTSAGALNGAALVQGLAEDGPAGARARLRRLWEAVGERSPLRGFDMPDSPFDPLLDGLSERWLDAARSWGRYVSPYSPALPEANALDAVLADVIDCDALARAPVPLFVSATNVRTGDLRVFGGAGLDRRALLASACLPEIFRAVEIDGERYWDGGYVANPALEPLIEREGAAGDLLIVQVTPFRREAVPQEADEIVNRVTEITFSASLLRELRTLADVQRLLRDEAVASPAVRRLAALRVHMVPADPRLGELPASSKLDTRLSHLAELFDMGRAAGRRWLDEEAGAVGVECGLDLDALLAAHGRALPSPAFAGEGQARHAPG